MDPTPTPMSTLLTTIGSIITEIVTWLGDILNLYETEPILQLTLGFLMIGGVIGICSRLISKG